MADKQYPTPTSGGEPQQAPPQTSGETQQTTPTYNSEIRPAAPYVGGERRQMPSSAGGERRQTPAYNSERRPAGPYRSGERRQTSSGSGSERWQTSSLSGGERRQTPTYNSERRPAAPYVGGERRQTSSGSGGERWQTSSLSGGERRQAGSYASGSGSRRPQSPRRIDVIRCENCGEDYSVTYKRCPFCDERPGRGGAAGKRVANTRGGGYGRPASTLKTITWIASFVVVCAAMFIIYRFIGAPIFGGGKDPSSSSQSGAGSSQGASSSQSGGDVSTPGGLTPITPIAPVTPVPPDAPTTTEIPGTIVNASSGLNVRSGPSKDSSRVGSLKNTSQVTVLGEEGDWYHIRYNGTSTGYVRKDFVSTASAPVAVQQPNTTTTPTTPSTPDTNTPSTPSTASGTRGVIVNAGSGVRIRSGPGTGNSVLASATNGAEVTILGEENGWYRIRYNGDKTGYVRKDFVSSR